MLPLCATELLVRGLCLIFTGRGEGEDKGRVVSIPCRALPRAWEEANAAKNWAVARHCPRWLWLPENMNKPESMGEGQHCSTVCMQLFGTNAKQKRWTISVTFSTRVTVFLVYRSGSVPHASTHTQAEQSFLHKAASQKKQLSYTKHLVCGDEANPGASGKEYVCTHALCTALEKSTSTVNCSG